MGVSPRVTIGPFVVGEKPAPLQYQFQDSAGQPINLVGYTARFSVKELGGSTITADCVVATITDAVNGIVTYSWTGTEFPTAGRYVAELWVGNTTQRFASILIDFTVRCEVACVPAI